MKYLKVVSFLIGTFILISFQPGNADTFSQKEISEKPVPDKIEVLNFGTFHIGFTNDANKPEFDEHDQKNQERVHAVAKKLAKFDPTVIIVEQEPRHTKRIQNEYQQYREKPDIASENPSEVELLAYKIGRLSRTV